MKSDAEQVPNRNALDGARQWVRRGYYTFPVPYQEKGAKLKDSQNLRLTADDLPRYFTGEPQNVAVLQGEPNGASDIDLDCIEAVTAFPHFAPETALIYGRKSKPRSHWFYRTDPPCRSVKYLDPIDHKTLLEFRCLKSDGTTGLYTLAPPSIHPSGEPIEFWRDCDREPANVDAEELGRAVRCTAAVALMARHWPAAQGGRHDAFLALAGTLAYAKWALNEATHLVCALYRTLWPANADLAAGVREVESTYQRHGDGHEIAGLPALLKLVPPAAVKQMAKWLAIGQAPPAVEIWEAPIPLQSRSVPALRVDRIPGALGDMVAAVARATETPVELAALLGTAVVSSSIAKKVIVQVEVGYSEPVNLYVAPAMESGNRKTAVLNYMTAPLMDWEALEARRCEPEIKRATSKRKTIDARIEWLRKRAAKAPLDSSAAAELMDMEASLPEIPSAPRLWMQDMTAEVLAVEMQQQGERMAVLSDEGGLFDILAGRYNGIPNFDLVNQAHSSSPVRVNRISRPPVFLRSPVLTIGISPQPDVLAQLSATPQFRGRGLLARFLYAVPASPLGARSLERKPCADHILDAYRQLIGRLLRLSPPECEGVWRPWTLSLSPGAYEHWKAFQRYVEGLMKEGARLQYLRDWASKLPGATARIAGIFHCVVADPAATSDISCETMEQAIDLATPLIEHALLAFDLMGRDPTVEDAQKILAWIRREQHPEFALRDCFRAHQSRFRRVGQISPALHLLVEHDYLRLAPQGKVAYRPSERYQVNPKVYEVTR